MEELPEELRGLGGGDGPGDAEPTPELPAAGTRRRAYELHPGCGLVPGAPSGQAFFVLGGARQQSMPLLGYGSRDNFLEVQCFRDALSRGGDNPRAWEAFGPTQELLLERSVQSLASQAFYNRSLKDDIQVIKAVEYLDLATATAEEAARKEREGVVEGPSRGISQLFPMFNYEPD